MEKEKVEQSSQEKLESKELLEKIVKAARTFFMSIPAASAVSARLFSKSPTELAAVEIGHLTAIVAAGKVAQYLIQDQELDQEGKLAELANCIAGEVTSKMEEDKLKKEEPNLFGNIQKGAMA